MDVKRTEHDFWLLWNCLYRHMIHLASIGRRLISLLLITILDLRSLLIWLSWTVIREMSFLTTDIALIWSIWSTTLLRSGS